MRNQFNWCIGGIKRSEKDDVGRPFRTNFPLENHPNPQSHRLISDNISIALSSLLETVLLGRNSGG